MAARDHHSAPVDAQRAVLGMNAEELGGYPAQAHGLGAEALNEVRAGVVDVRPRGGAEISARGGSWDGGCRGLCVTLRPRAEADWVRVREGASRLPADGGADGI